jgi:hypothetical protein
VTRAVARASTTADRTEAIARLTVWVEQIYAPCYRHLAGMLADCWRQHDLCLFILDFVSELHRPLYVRPSGPRERSPTV